MGKSQHVVLRDKGWAVKSEGSTKASTVKPTQQQAIRTAVKIAKREKSEVVVHGRDGRIRGKSSYGNDPKPPKDRKP